MSLPSVANVSAEVVGHLPGKRRSDRHVSYPQFRVQFDNGDGERFDGIWDSRSPLLSANTKLKKLPGRAAKYRAIGLALAPWKYAGSGNLCAHASDACIQACNGLFSGMNCTPSTRIALIGRARLYLEFRALFLRKLREEIVNFCKLCKRSGVIPAFRLNVSSDIPWERVSPDIVDLIQDNGGRQYDYTKAPPGRRTAPAGYELSYSFSERTTFSDVERCIGAGMNIVAAFDSAYNPADGMFGALPRSVTFVCRSTGKRITLQTVNGDRHDLRIRAMDGRGILVGLHGKGGRERAERATDGGFFIAAGDDGKRISRRRTTFGAPVERVC